MKVANHLKSWQMRELVQIKFEAKISGQQVVEAKGRKVYT